MSEDSLRQRLTKGEHNTTAFVEDAEDALALSRSICALLNGRGGVVFIGVGAKGHGPGISDHTINVVSNLELKLRQAITPSAYFTISPLTLDDKKVLVVEIPEGQDKPYMVEYIVWLRQGKETKPANAQSLQKLLKEVGPRWERQISEDMSYDDVDQSEVRATVRDAQSSNRHNFENPEDDISVLKELSALTTGGYTHAGDLLFSTAPTTRFPQARAQLIVLDGEKTGPQYRDNRSFEGPMVRVCNELIQAVASLNRVASSFNPGTTQRQDVAAYDEFSIREGIVNAFVHRDYSSYSGGLSVSVYRSRIEIWNSGDLPKGLTVGALSRPHESIQINPDIAQIFYYRKMMERVGRGTELIIANSLSLNAKRPSWKVTATGVTLTLYSAHMTEELVADDGSLNARQTKLLATLPPHETISLKDFCAQYAPNVSPRQARRDLEELVQVGKLQQKGKGPATVYGRVLE